MNPKTTCIPAMALMLLGVAFASQADIDGLTGPNFT